MKTRDNTIDFFRGIATIWIIFIHTCFHSGDAYVADWLRSLSLIIDVPLFMFISGMTFNFNNNFFKTIKSIIKIWYKWLLFLILFFVVAVIFYGTQCFSIENIINAIFFKVDGNGHMVPSVNYSMWFIYMFFVVVIFSNIIIYFYKKYNKTIDNFKYVLLILFLFFGMDMCNDGFLVFSPIILMYTFIYCLGYYLYNFKFKSFKSCLYLLVPIIVLLLLLFNFSDSGFLDLQNAKFAPHINYLVYSLLSIIIFTYLKDRIKINDKNIFCFIGKNALLFYFCQGIGASLIYFLYPFVKDLPGTILIMFIANVIITTICFTMIYFLNKKLDSVKKFNIQIFEKK